MEKAEPHPIAHHELELTMLVVILPSLEKTLTNLHEGGVTITQEGVQ